MQHYLQTMFSINCNGKLLSLETPVVMGIINATPNSFYEASRQNTTDAALKKVEQMLQEGASIVDIGGQTTKSGSIAISAEDELQRVLPIITALHQHFPEAIISIDTYYSKVAEEAVLAGASIVNDISGGLLDIAMIDTVAKLKTPYICMHMQGNPENMQINPVYENVTQDILQFFIERIDTCTKAGIKDFIVDIGFGFGKTNAHNFQLLKELEVFKMLQKPILLGVSRKSSIYKTLGITANEALNGTTVLNTIGLQNGANILRVHDVKEAIECIKLTDAVYEPIKQF